MLALAMILVLAACSAKDETVDYAGTYDIVRIEGAETAVSEEDMQELRGQGYEAMMDFADGGTGLMRIDGDEMDFTYDAGAGTVSLNGVVSTMAFGEDGLLVITEGDSRMYLKKRTED
jgi:hypothetical protein